MLPDLPDLDDWLAAREAQVPGLKPGCAKRVDWPSAERSKAALSVLYVHGFSASGREVSPVPERVAEALGAPLFVTRLTGHGQDGSAMVQATVDEWEADVREAIEIAALLGDRVLVIACSTGATLVTSALAACDLPCPVVGIVMISPNFGMRKWYLQGMLDAPGGRTWAPFVTPRELKLKPRSPEHEAYWTLRYPPRAVFAADDAVKRARAAPVGRIAVPAFVAICEKDQVVHPARTRKIMGQWGGPVTQREMVMGPGDDPMGHLVVGDIQSPGQTEAFIRDVLIWARKVV